MFPVTLSGIAMLAGGLLLLNGETPMGLWFCFISLWFMLGAILVMIRESR